MSKITNAQALPESPSESLFAVEFELRTAANSYTNGASLETRKRLRIAATNYANLASRIDAVGLTSEIGPTP